MRIFTFKSIILIYIFFSPLLVFSQNSSKNINKKNYSLLWEITGKGLTKPSYLFGTMHLKDERVFEFSDSVLIKLSECDVFASEVRLDSILYQTWEIAYSGDTTNHLRHQLSKSAYKRLVEALKSKGINIDSMESKNPALIADLLEDREYSKYDKGKDVFLDLYLTRQAYIQGKELAALERLESYEDLNKSFFNLFEDSSFYKTDTVVNSIISYLNHMEDMIKVYQTGDIDTLLAFMRRDSQKDTYQTELLDKRNLKMLERLEDLMSNKSVFCAVGAAHLPDSLGLIQLLKQKGYTLRKVTPQFTGLAQSFKPKISNKEWYHLKDDFNYLEVDFPEQPYLMNKVLSKSKRIGMSYLHYDLMTNSVNLLEAEYFPRIKMKKKAQEEFLEDAFKYWIYLKGFTDINKEMVKLDNGTEGYQFTARTNTNNDFVKGRFFIANNNFYKLYSILDKEHESQIERTDRFLTSFKINPLPLTDWFDFEDEKAAFKIRMPNQPKFQEIKIPTDNKINFYSNLYVSQDNEEGFYYAVRYSDMPRGLYIENDTFYLHNVINEMLSNVKKLNTKVEIDSITRHYGYPEIGVKFTFDGIPLMTRAIIRGNRLYVLIGQPPMKKSKNNIQKLEQWLNSFRLIPHMSPQLNVHKFPELGINVGLPTSKEPYELIKDDGSFAKQISKQNIQVTDDRTGVVYVITRTEYPRYYSAVSQDSFWNTMNIELTNIDSISKFSIQVKDTLFKGLKGKIITQTIQNSQNVFKVLRVLKDGYLYDFSLTLPFELTSDTCLKPYFDAIEFTENKVKHDIFSDKKAILLSDLATTTDSAVFIQARWAINSTKWEKKDLPLLLDAFKKTYRDDTLNYGARNKILNNLIEFKDIRVLNCLEEMVKDSIHLPSAINENVIRGFLLLDTFNSVERFFELAQIIPNKSYHTESALQVFMQDSLSRAKQYYDKALSLYQQPFKSNRLLQITSNLAEIDSSHILSDIFKKYTPQYLKAAQEAFDSAQDIIVLDTIDYESKRADALFLLTSYVELFKNIPQTPEIKDLLLKIASKTRQVTLLRPTIHALLKRNIQVPTSAWQTMSNEPIALFQLLQALKSDSLMPKVPIQFLKQKDVVEGCILNYLELEEYGKPEELKLLDTQKYEGQSLYIYKVKYNYGANEDSEDEEELYIFICSQPLDKKEIQVEPKLLKMSTQITIEELKKYNSIVKTLLEEYEKSLKTKQ